MDHAEARELIELAAIEPHGLDRLTGGDTPEAAALAGHLAGCPDCTEEVGRLRREAAVIRTVIRSTPGPDLRDRTLAFVAQVGRPRPGLTALPGAGGAGDAGVPVGPAAVMSREAGAGARASGRRSRAPLTTAWIASLAAAVVIAVGGTAWVLDQRHQQELAGRDARFQAQGEVVAALGRVSEYAMRIEAEGDGRHVDLASSDGTGAHGSLLYSTGSGELVVVAEGLAEPPTGQEFRCWFEAGGRRLPIGKMFFGGGLSYWAGGVDQLDALAAGGRFGVSLVPVGGDPVAGDPVLAGET